MSTTSARTRHPVHWDPAGNIIMLLDNVLYQLDRNTLIRSSGMFQGMIAMPPPVGGTQTEGSSENNPVALIQLSGRGGGFDLFVAQAYGMFMPQVMNIKVLIDALWISDFLIAPTLRAYALYSIESRKWYFEPADLLYVSRAFKTRRFFVHAFERLVSMKIWEISDEDIQKMSYPIFIAAVRMMAVVTENRHIVACEPPSILNHSAECQDPTQCANDWRAVWWNGMARFLLDGRNPLTFKESFNRFQFLQFGAVSEGCKEAMFAMIKDSGAFHRGQARTQVYAQTIAELFIEQDPIDALSNLL